MKKILGILTILTLTFALNSNAQGKTPISNYTSAVGVTISNDVTTDWLKVGKNFGQNNLSVVGSMSNTKTKAWGVGVEYTRAIYNKGGFTFKTGGSVLMDISKNTNHKLTFFPGVSGGIKLTKNLSLEANLSTPIYEGSTLFKPTNLMAGAQLVVTL
jgi:hypothetical protein